MVEEDDDLLSVQAAPDNIGGNASAAQRRWFRPRGYPSARARRAHHEVENIADAPLYRVGVVADDSRSSLGRAGGRPHPSIMSICRALALSTRAAARSLRNAVRGVSAMQRMLPERKASTPSLHVRLTDRWRCRVNHVLVDPTLYYFRDDCCARAVVVTDPTTVGKHVRKAVLHVSHPARSEI